jgi:hypothetical protein
MQQQVENEMKLTFSLLVAALNVGTSEMLFYLCLLSTTSWHNDSASPFTFGNGSWPVLVCYWLLNIPAWSWHHPGVFFFLQPIPGWYRYWVLIENVMTCQRFPSVLGGLVKSVRFPTPDMGGHIMFLIRLFTHFVMDDHIWGWVLGFFLVIHDRLHFIKALRHGHYQNLVLLSAAALGGLSYTGNCSLLLVLVLGARLSFGWCRRQVCTWCGDWSRTGTRPVLPQVFTRLPSSTDVRLVLPLLIPVW